MSETVVLSIAGFLTIAAILLVLNRKWVRRNKRFTETKTTAVE